MKPEDITKAEKLQDILARQPDSKTALDEIVLMLRRGELSAFKQDGVMWIESNEARHGKITND